MAVDPQVQALVVALLDRGYHVTDAKPGVMPKTVALTFDLVKGVGYPSWLKAFELPRTHATPNHFELAVSAFQMKVLKDIALGHPSAVVRRIIAEHGSRWVIDCLKPRFENV